MMDQETSFQQRIALDYIPFAEPDGGRDTTLPFLAFIIYKV